jgi:hypothetical protein
LRIDRGTDRVVRGREGSMEPAAGGLDDVPVVRRDRAAQDLLVPRKRGLHRLGVLLPEARRALEVGEDEGHRP